MTALPLSARRIEKPWGRRTLGEGFDPVPSGSPPVGEIVFESPNGAADELLLKYLFTSEKLSIQVHPDDSAARARGMARGKDEAWLVLDAEADSTLGLGLSEPAAPEALRAAALDGSLEALVDWRPVRAGDCIYSPAGTIHAIGAGVSLVEVQQSTDVTYRLYDYGRPRELHLDEALAVARPQARPAAQPPLDLGDGRIRLAAGPAFQMERLDGACEGRLSAPAGTAIWLLPLGGPAELDGRPMPLGSAWLVPDSAKVRLGGEAQILLAYPGGVTLPVWQAGPS
ncbi:MAG TPA: class I mannose-6-phosphate isomerase [Allosphingosinicella sp.]